MRVPLKHLANFLRQFATLMESGIPVLRGLETMRRNARSFTLRHAVTRIRRRIEEGEHLHEAVEHEGKTFPALVIRMIDIGETSGTLDDVLASLADYYEWQLRLRRRVIASFILPGIQFVVAIAVVTLVIYLTTMFSGGTGAGEKARLFLFSWVLIVVVVFGLYFFMTRIIATKKFFDYVILNLPIFGMIARRLCIARLSFAMNLMIRAAIPFPEMLVKAAEATGNQAFVSRFSRAAEGIESGTALTEVLRGTRLLDRHFLEVVEVGEESGKLDDALARLAIQRGEDAQRAVQYLATALAWLVYIMVACIIIYYIFKIFLTLYLGTYQQLLQDV
jgi:type IV pilus assembly protein PilC